jgi:hypothetical protein
VDELKIEELISAEAKRLSDRYGKDYLTATDIRKITGLGKDKVRNIMLRKDFPSLNLGKRKIVSVVGFATWQIKNMRH